MTNACWIFHQPGIPRRVGMECPAAIYRFIFSGRM
jgi:hypothetical protein